MEVLITSCGRNDLLSKTINSLIKNQTEKLFIIINEDGFSKIGQHASIERYLKSDMPNSKYFIGCEDDWEFDNYYDWISESIKIMEADPTIIKVLCRLDFVHPVEFKNGYGILEPWTDPWKSNVWHGFSWNPGITRLDLLKQFTPFEKTEQEVSEAIYKAGYKTVILEKGVCKHIGQDRSTHEN